MNCDSKIQPGIKKAGIALLLSLALCSASLTIFAQTNNSYSFIVAGHTYGAHAGTNIGLYPKFLASLDAGFDTTTRFMVFTGDLVNVSTTASWQQVDLELNKYNLPCYYSMGNHDANAIGIAEFEKKFGKTYYSFDYHKERFIVLNSTEKDRAISDNQLVFLQEKLSTTGDTINRVFIFFHEVLWNSLEKYKGVLANSRSRYAQIKTYSNYWTAVHPLLEQYPEKNFYVFAGDVGGNTDAIAAFYDNWGNITLLASGMGEVADENYLLVTVKDDGNVAYNLVPLNVVTLNNIEFYSVPKQPEIISGASTVKQDTLYEYAVSEIDNADTYTWQLPDHATGTSTSNSIKVMFDKYFITGNITVSAASQAFGSSTPVTKSISLIGNSIKSETEGSLVLNTIWNGQVPVLTIYSELFDYLHIEIYTVGGRKIYSKYIQVEGGIEKQLLIPALSSSIYVACVQGTKTKINKKIFVW